MKLTKLFDTQRILDARIEKEHPRFEGEDRLAKKILALQVELGECANEWRGFKFWSTDQIPRGYRSITADGVLVASSNPLLEEYVDCLHFILSIGLEMNYFNEINVRSVKHKENNITYQFNQIYANLSALWSSWLDERYEFARVDYENVAMLLIGLSEMLGFTWEQIEQAYYDKNAINHTRQDTGY